VPTLETPMSPGGSQASAGEGLSPCNIGIGIGIWWRTGFKPEAAGRQAGMLHLFECVLLLL